VLLILWKLYCVLDCVMFDASMITCMTGWLKFNLKLK